MSISKHRHTDETTLTGLIAIIEKSHHHFTRTEIERIAAILKDEQLATFTYLKEISGCFTKLQEDLEAHLLKEERILFPYISEMERNPSQPQYSCFGSIENPIRKMQLEHIAVISILEELRELTMHYCRESGNNSMVIQLYEALAGLDRDLIQHIHLEEKILFPRTLRMSKESLPKNQS